MPYLEREQEKNCFRCEHLGASLNGYICKEGFHQFQGQGATRTIWTGDLALICPLFEPRVYADPVIEAGGDVVEEGELETD